MKHLIGLLLLLSAISSCQESEKPIKTSSLTDLDQTTLLYMREEEKLAKDIYTYAFNEYGILAFQNIASSENQHMQAILTLMNSYQIDDPLKGSITIGEFTIPEINNIYQQLLTKVNESASQALLVGLLIEDLDIADLDNAISATNNNSITLVYENLKCGSQNHLRTFEDFASLAGLSYSPVYISLTDYTNIINTPRNTCNI